MTLDAVATISAARLIIARKTPYFAMSSVKLVPHAMPGLRTMGVTKDWILMYDPEAVVEWGPEETAGVIVHELNHRLRQHCERIATGPFLANVAKDLAINPDVIATKYKIPKGGVFPKQYGWEDGLTSEEYYARLQQLPPDEQPQQSGKRGGQEEPGGEGDEQGGEPQPGDVGPCAGWCGSGAGNPFPNEPDGKAEGGRSEAEAQAIAKATAEAVHDYVQQHGRGNMPAGMMRWADEVLKPPKVRWQDKLARVCRTAVAYRPGCGEVSYHSYSRRQAGIGFGIGKAVLPCYRQKVPRVDVLIDTSGSMGEEQLNRCVAECDGILRQVGAKVRLICCDANVETFEFVRNAKEILGKLKGGGGTDFNPAFRRIDNTQDKPEVLIVLTDGDASVPALPPRDYVVIWCVIDGTHAPTEWGECIDIKSGEAE